MNGSNELNIKCEICGKEIKSTKGFCHVTLAHKISAKDYYDKYLKKPDEEICPLCNEPTPFLGVYLGYQKHCGAKCSQGSEERIVKFKETRSKCDENLVKQKRAKTNLERHGNENANATDKIKQKSRDKCFEKNGVYNPGQTESAIKKRHDTRQKNHINNVVFDILKNKNLEMISEYKDATEEATFRCLICNNEFKSIWNYVQQWKKCPICFPSNTQSKPEDEIVEFLTELGISNIIRRNRKIISPREIDIYIPDKNIAIEFDGFYRHSDETDSDPSKNPHYHLDKTISCNDQNIRLIHIFEDEWLFKKDIVKSRLRQIFKSNNQLKIYARKCIIKEISPTIKNEFLDKFHIQGKDSSVIKLGAFYNEELISVMTFGHGNISKGSKHKDDIWELNRFCSNSNYQIPGIASKFLSYFKKNYIWSEIFSYADRRWSDGDLYYKLGFEFKHNTSINYWYNKGYKRIHRFSLRKTELDPKEIPEHIIRRQEGYFIIWDCGSIKFSMINKLLEDK